ncbi:MAG: AI-2E family transporter [Ignavibacterium album]|jgi:predicted PurR-regulated permease PerM|uniref:AI-2E family transporter n=1 Tax=Ignavibacterium album TaxID=591197 RepID=A0A7V3E820_9BACT|nr:AI-2E family transporter [Ignavibacterium album]MCX8104775.1 AI-2E family transporter [Ignavibacterium album]
MAHKVYSDNTTKFFITIIGLVVIAIVLKELSHIFIPLVIAIFLYFVFAPLNNFLSAKKFPGFLITILDLIITILILYSAGRIVVDSLLQFADGLPTYGDKLNSIVRDIARELNIRDPFFRKFDLEQTIQRLDYKSLAGGIFSSTINLAGSVLFVLFFFVFVLSGEKTIYEAIKNYYVFRKVKPQFKKIKKSLYTSHQISDRSIETELQSERLLREKQLAETFNTITDQIQRYIIAKFGLNLIAGIITAIALSIVGLDFPIVWGLFVFLFNFIPTIGSAAALVLPVLFALVQFDSTSSAFLIAIVMAVIQTLAFNLAEPMIIGRRLNLNPLLILLSVLIWGYIWGIVGMLIAVPITAIIKIILSNSKSNYLKFLSNLMSQSQSN